MPLKLPQVHSLQCRRYQWWWTFGSWGIWRYFNGSFGVLTWQKQTVNVWPKMVWDINHSTMRFLVEWSKIDILNLSGKKLKLFSRVCWRRQVIFGRTGNESTSFQLSNVQEIWVIWYLQRKTAHSSISCHFWCYEKNPWFLSKSRDLKIRTPTSITTYPNTGVTLAERHGLWYIHHGMWRY